MKKQNRSIQWVVLMILLLVASLIVLYLFRKNQQLEQKLSTSAYFVSQSNSNEYISSKKGEGWREMFFNSSDRKNEKGVRYFEDFNIHFPKSWKAKMLPFGVDGKILELSQGSTLITIRQGEEGRGDCYYPADNRVKEGMEEIYANEYSVQRNDVKWKVGELSYKPNTYEVCESSVKGRGFGGFTKIGTIIFSSPVKNDKALAEFKEILANLEIKLSPDNTSL